MSDVTIPDRPALVTIPNVELVKTGHWELSSGPFDCTAEDLMAAVAAQDDPAIRAPILKLGHIDPRFDGEPAIGRVTNMRVSEDGQTLLGDIEGVPAWIADVMPSAWPSRSFEGYQDYSTGNGTNHRFVLTALALLGVTLPGIETLADVASLYGIAASEEPDTGRFVTATFEEGAMPKPAAASVSTEDIRRQYYDEAAWAWWICEIQIDPAQLIVENEDEGEMYRVPYTISGDTVSFDDPVKVVVTYVDVAAAAKPAKPPVVFASRAESRPEKPRRKPAASAPKGEKGGLVEVTDKIREALGLADDVTEIDEDALLAKLEEIKTPAPEPEKKPAELPEGVVAIEKEVLEEMRSEIAASRSVTSRYQGEERKQLVAAALAEGKIHPTRTSYWEGELERDFDGTTKVLAALEKGSAVPVTEIGNGGGGGDTSDDALYAAIYPERFQKEA